MNSNIDIQSITQIQLHKLIFISNALNEGWSVNKNNDKYIFRKNHDNKKEIFLDNYLENFIYKNISNITINDV
tara:strand:+ start:399 stop:617 length:219 start_codon:yes stop_codon:yes gene_type:complete